jgi:hypothetical protein
MPAKNEEVDEKLMLLSVLITGLALSGCEFVAGTLVGAGAAGGGYEYQAYRQMQQLEDDYKNRRISREEYEDRKNRSRRDRSFTSSSLSMFLTVGLLPNQRLPA